MISSFSLPKEHDVCMKTDLIQRFFNLKCYGICYMVLSFDMLFSDRINFHTTFDSYVSNNSYNLQTKNAFAIISCAHPI